MSWVLQTASLVLALWFEKVLRRFIDYNLQFLLAYKDLALTESGATRVIFILYF